MAFGHEKLDSASEGMLFARNWANTEWKKSTPIPTPKEAMTSNRQPLAGGDGIPRHSHDDGLRRAQALRVSVSVECWVLCVGC